MNPTILLALDGATYTVLDPLMDEGVMPNLSSLIRDGVRATLMSTAHPLTPQAFTTMMTGRGPGSHGIYDFVRGEDREGQVYFTFCDSRDVRCETVWSIANRFNRKVSRMNFVLTSPVMPICGVTVPGMVHWRHLRRHTHPSTFYKRLKAQPWFDAKVMCWDHHHVGEALNADDRIDQKQWVREHIDREAQWFQVLKCQMKDEPTDLVSIVLDGVDKLQHVCWEVLDPDLFPDSPEPWQRELRAACVEYFRLLDGYIAEIIALAGPGARTFIASDHGFGPERTLVRINQFLQEQGYLFWKEGIDIREDQREMVLPVDWSRTVAYAPTRSGNGIHIRVAASPRETGVAPGEYLSFRAALIESLRKLKDPETGGPIVRRAMVREEMYGGHAVHLAPDITLQFQDYGLLWTSPGESVVERKQVVTGMHYPEGVFIAHGEGIRRGAESRTALDMVDIAPTLLHSLGVPVPRNFEGRVPDGVFEDAWLDAHPVEPGEPAFERIDDEVPVTPAVELRSEEDDRLAVEQLRALGYME